METKPKTKSVIQDFPQLWGAPADEAHHTGEESFEMNSLISEKRPPASGLFSYGTGSECEVRVFLFHLLPCLSTSPAVPSPISYGVGNHHACVGLHS